MSAQTSAGAAGSTCIVPVVALVTGVVLVVLGQFFLDGLADTSDTWHWIQHGVIFAGLLLTAPSLIITRRRQLCVACWWHWKL